GYGRATPTANRRRSPAPKPCPPHAIVSTFVERIIRTPHNTTVTPVAAKGPAAMKPLPVGIGIALLTVLAVSAQDTASVTREVLRLEQVTSNAVVKKDRAVVQPVYADDYSYIHSNGSVADKALE